MRQELWVGQSTDRAPAAPPALRATFATQLQLKLGQEGLLLENFWPRVKKSATGRRSEGWGVASRKIGVPRPLSMRLLNR
jgi:hypothetical protein